MPAVMIVPCSPRARCLSRTLQVALLLIPLAGCVSTGGSFDTPRQSPVARADLPPGGTWQQCAPYARENSAIKIFGDASTWWQQASARYQRERQPSSGAVMVLHDYAGKDRGHVAVVQAIVSAREIRVNHANWLNDDRVLVDNPVRDVSQANDWSEVRVWNVRVGSWGTKAYPVQGFIRAAAQPAIADSMPALLAQQQAPMNPPDGSPFALTEEDKAIPY